MPSTSLIPETEIARLRAAGVSMEKIAAHYGLKVQTVRYRERSLGYPPRLPGTRPTPNVDDILGDTKCTSGL